MLDYRGDSKSIQESTRFRARLASNQAFGDHPWCSGSFLLSVALASMASHAQAPFFQLTPARPFV
jgi:hypothetical protein